MATVSLESKTFEKFPDLVGRHDDANYLNHDHSITSWNLCETGLTGSGFATISGSTNCGGKNT